MELKSITSHHEYVNSFDKMKIDKINLNVNNKSKNDAINFVKLLHEKTRSVR
jgi:hypothetical protein